MSNCQSEPYKAQADLPEGPAERLGCCSCRCLQFRVPELSEQPVVGVRREGRKRGTRETCGTVGEGPVS